MRGRKSLVPRLGAQRWSDDVGQSGCSAPGLPEETTMSKRNRVERIPRWLRERKPPPHPLAFRQFVERIPPVTCCPVHRESQRRLLAAVRAPAGRCLLCGAQGTWRARWPLPATPAPVPTPCCLHATEEELGLYYDLCDRCQQR